ncbi:MAG: ThuA domain-containing protein [Thermoguttaceae bacterium]
MKRRQVLQSLGAAALGWPLAALPAPAGETARRKVLFFSRSVLFEHPVIRREGGALSFAEKTLTTLGAQAGLDVQCTKEGSVFDGDLGKYDAMISYSCGYPADLAKPQGLDGSSPVTPEGRRRLLEAVASGKGFVAIHPGLLLLPEAVGADCIGHGAQQAATMRVTSPEFPGLKGAGSSFSLTEEWFSLYRFAKDIHVILAQDCRGMKIDSPADKKCYDRPPFPSTWCRMHGRGRVFFTAMGHREDVWTNRLFQQILLGGLQWALRHVHAAIPPNLEQVAPDAEKTNS